MYECPICHKKYSAMYCDDCQKAIPRECKVFDEPQPLSSSQHFEQEKKENEELKRKLYKIESIVEDTNTKVKIIFAIVIASIIISLVSGIVVGINVSNAISEINTATSSHKWYY